MDDRRPAMAVIVFVRTTRPDRVVVGNRRRRSFGRRVVGGRRTRIRRRG